MNKETRNFVWGLVLVLLCAVFSSCGTSHIEFTIQWSEVWKTVGLIVLGAFIVIVLLLYLFRNFRVW